ncbi:hypothetical protein SLE2022_094080 [Rubroshorea leprosula]
MASLSLRRRLHYPDRASRGRFLRSQKKRKGRTAIKSLKANFRRLKADIQEISKDQQNIKEGQKQVREKLEAIEAECAQLRTETDLMIRQSAASKLNLCLMFKILKAREEGDFAKATQLAQLLRLV